MKTMVFNNEEMVLINAICKNEKVSELTRGKVVQSLVFSRQITNDDDSMMIELIDGVMETVNSLSDAEWDELKLNIPFSVVYGEEDVAEVPTDEELL